LKKFKFNLPITESEGWGRDVVVTQAGCLQLVVGHMGWREKVHTPIPHLFQRHIEPRPYPGSLAGSFWSINSTSFALCVWTPLHFLKQWILGEGGTGAWIQGL
jgi:hypothetical protein